VKCDHEVLFLGPFVVLKPLFKDGSEAWMFTKEQKILLVSADTRLS
jgi:hypothetical protein